MEGSNVFNIATEVVVGAFECLRIECDSMTREVILRAVVVVPVQAELGVGWYRSVGGSGSGHGRCCCGFSGDHECSRSCDEGNDSVSELAVLLFG